MKMLFIDLKDWEVEGEKKWEYVYLIKWVVKSTVYSQWNRKGRFNYAFQVQKVICMETDYWSLDVQIGQ